MQAMEQIKLWVSAIWRRVLYLVSRFGSDHCSQIAAALTYMSLFALVPLLTVLYTMASAIPTFQGLEHEIQQFLFENLMPDTSSEIEQYLSDFSRQAKNLTGFGIAFLVVTAVLMLRNIEKAFNMIWRTRENRGYLSSFLLYWAVLSLSPIFIGLALGISTYVTSLALRFEDYDPVGMGSYLLRFSPLLLSWAAFSLVYVAVPNCRVPFRHALVGGFIAAAAFNIARSLFTTLVVNSSYTFIYGAFAAVPLFLLWIYLSWNIVLVGGILVHSLSAYQTLEQKSRPTVLKALDVLYLLWLRQQSGKDTRELELLSGRHEVVRGLDSDTWRELREVLMVHDVITQNERGRYLLCRDLDAVTFWQLKEWINDELPLGEEELQSRLPWQDEAYRLLRQQRNQQRELLGITLSELFRYK
jgi:membrane protein